MKYIVIILCSLILIFPLYLMFIGSFQNIKGIMKMPPNFLPRNPTWDNYVTLLRSIPLFRWSLNTTIISSSAVLLTVTIAFFSGYAMSFMRRRYRRIIFILFLIPIMIPAQALLIPLYVTVRRMRLPAMVATILPATFSPVSIFLAMNYIDNISRDIIDAARLDGAGNLKIIFSMVVPLSKPILACIGILSFLGTLGAYVWQYLLLRADNQKTLLIGITETVMRSADSYKMVNPIGVQLAAGVILFVPMFIVFISFQKYFQSGLTLGGIK